MPGRDLADQFIDPRDGGVDADEVGTRSRPRRASDDTTVGRQRDGIRLRPAAVDRDDNAFF
jgi:hypothetical protein